jgi:hypothetical protein
MRITRTNLQICEDIAHTLVASDRTPLLIVECIQSPHMREDILRDRLKAHNVPASIADEFVAKYVEAKHAQTVITEATQAEERFKRRAD